jgi:hypothetical protein
MSLQPEDVTFALALEDSLPVVLAGLGVFWLTTASADRVLARLGTGLVLAGGSAKVLWKLAAAGFGVDLASIDTLLFPLLGAGFACVVAALLGQRALALSGPAAVLAAVAVQATWPCLVLTVVASTTTYVLAIRRGFHQRDLVAAALVCLTLVAAYGLVPLATQETQTLALQWLEQSINTVAQGAFALGAFRLATRQGRPVLQGATT